MIHTTVAHDTGHVRQMVARSPLEFEPTTGWGDEEHRNCGWLVDNYLVRAETASSRAKYTIHVPARIPFPDAMSQGIGRLALSNVVALDQGSKKPVTSLDPRLSIMLSLSLQYRAASVVF